MQEGLLIKIGADTVEVKKSLADLQSQLKRFQTSLKTATDPATIERLNRAILRTKEYVKGVQTAGLSNGLNKVSAASGQAGFALQNLGRVASDAPFGFIAIQNNLDPLLQSFGSLSKTAGGTGGALKALGSALIGPAGLAVGFAIVGALITKGVQEYGSLSNAMNVVFGLTSNLENAQRDLSKAYAESAGSAAGEVAQIRSLVAIAKDETLSKNERMEAVKVLNKEYDNYLPNLSLENIATQQVTDATNRLTDSLVRQAKIKGLQDLISKETTKQYEIAANAIDELTKKTTVFDKVVGVLKSPMPGVGNTTREIFSASKEYDKAAERIGLFTRALNGLNKEEAKAGTLSPDEADKKVKAKKKETDALQEQISVLEKLKSTVGLLKVEEAQLLELKVQVALRDQKGNNLNDGQLQRVINELVGDANLEATPTVVPIQFKPTVGVIDASSIPEGAFTAVTEQLQKSGQAAGVAVNEAIDLERLTATANLVTETLTPAFTGLFDSLISGSQTALQAVGQFLKDIIKRLAQAAIQAAIFAGIMTAFGLGGPGASFGSLFKGQLLGGLGGGMQVNPMSGGGARGAALNNVAVMDVQIKGSDINLTQNRYNKSINRLG